MQIKIAPSILSADFARLGDDLKAAEAGGADWIHLDIMDGHFVPNLTFGPLVVRSVRRSTSLFLDAHLMIEQPLRYASAFAEAGADLITLHVETCPDVVRAVRAIRSLGVRAGVAFSPPTALSSLPEAALEDLSFILLLTVPPGFGGQPFMPEMLLKVRELRERLERRGLEMDVGVDGGIGPLTAPKALAAGANVLISGDYVFGTRSGIPERIACLRESFVASPTWR